MATTFAGRDFRACSISSIVNTSPIGRRMISTSARYLRHISSIRSPKNPLMQTSTGSPGSIMLDRAVSIAALPVPLTGMVSEFSVWNVYRSRC